MPSSNLDHATLQDKIDRALALLTAEADRHHGLIPSILNHHTGQMLIDPIPGPLPGQRQHDRSPWGSNLMHDIPLLELMILRSGQYARTADRYLQRFAHHCTDTPSGLFPWGEHAYWDLLKDDLGNANAWVGRTTSRGAYHDHLKEAPRWLWEKLYAIKPVCVDRFAQGLKYHWKGPPLAEEYFRHAYIQQPDTPLPIEALSRDFARHGGFYVIDWAYAYTKFGRQAFADHMVRMLDYWWPHRDETGLLPGMRRDDTADADRSMAWSLPQTLSYALSLLEAKAILEEAETLPALSRRLGEEARVYVDGCLSLPHALEAGRFVSALDRKTRQARGHFVAWGSAYGSAIAVSLPAMMMLRIGQHLRDERCLAWAKAAGDWLVHEPLDPASQAYARDAGQAVTLLVMLHEATGDAHWLEGALSLTQRLLPVYFDGPLPRAAAGADWYEGQTGSGDFLLAMGQLVHALNR